MPLKGNHAVSPYLFGKFCEHLGNNIYQGMEAQILFNPTLARWISTGALTVSTVACTPSTIGAYGSNLCRARRASGLSHGRLLIDEYMDGLAYGWFSWAPERTCASARTLSLT